jgi:hypothetical protein
MGNVYGIANPGVIAGVYTAGSDVVCNAGAETTVLTSGALSAPGPGDYYPVIFGVLVVLLGATPPGALTYAFKLGAGSDVDSNVVAAALLIANATLNFPIFLAGANSGTAWVGAGSTINITLLATVQNVTWKFSGSRAVVALFRGPDA